MIEQAWFMLATAATATTVLFVNGILYIIRDRPPIKPIQVGVSVVVYAILVFCFGLFGAASSDETSTTSIVIEDLGEWLTEDQTIDYAIGEIGKNIEIITKPVVRLAMWKGITGSTYGMDATLMAEYACGQVESVYDSTATWTRIIENSSPVTDSFDYEHYTGEKNYHAETGCTVRILAASVRNTNWWWIYTNTQAKPPTSRTSGSPTG